MSAALWVPLWLASIAGAGLIGRHKGYQYTGFVLGALLSVLGVVIIALKRPRGYIGAEWEQAKQDTTGEDR